MYYYYSFSPKQIIVIVCVRSPVRVLRGLWKVCASNSFSLICHYGGSILYFLQYASLVCFLGQKFPGDLNVASVWVYEHVKST